MIFGSPAVSTGRHQQNVRVTVVARMKTTMSGQVISLPQGEIEVTVSEFDIAPGTVLPLHRHMFPRYGYILSGTLEVTNEETGKTMRFGAGEFAIECVGQWHKGTNPGTEPLKLLVIDQAPKGVSNIETPE